MLADRPAQAKNDISLSVEQSSACAVRFNADCKARVSIYYIRTRDSNKVMPIQNPRPNTEIPTAGIQNKAIRREPLSDRLAV